MSQDMTQGRPGQHSWPTPGVTAKTYTEEDRMSRGLDDEMREIEHDAVRVLKLVQVVCDLCGWHSMPIESRGGGTSAAETWEQVHRRSCPAMSNE